MNEQIHYYISFVECFEKLLIKDFKFISKYKIFFDFSHSIEQYNHVIYYKFFEII